MSFNHPSPLASYTSSQWQDLTIDAGGLSEAARSGYALLEDVYALLDNRLDALKRERRACRFNRAQYDLAINELRGAIDHVTDRMLRIASYSDLLEIACLDEVQVSHLPLSNLSRAAEQAGQVCTLTHKDLPRPFKDVQLAQRRVLHELMADTHID